MNKQNIFYIFRQQKGQALLQALAGAALTGLIALSAVEYIRQTKKQQIAGSVSIRVADIKRAVQEVLAEDLAWQNTVNNVAGASMNCLKTTGTCVDQGWTAGASTPLSIPRIFDSKSALWLNTTTQGLNYAGNPCTGFVTPPATGTDTCPFRLTLTWQAMQPENPTQRCSTAPKGGKCLVKLIGQLTYNPRNPVPLKPDQLYFEFLREEKAVQIYFSVIDQKAQGTEGGACTAGSWITRDLGTKVIDTGSNIMQIEAQSIGGNPGDAIQVKKGTYNCEISAPAGNLTTHQARLGISTSTTAGSRCTGFSATHPGGSAYYYTPSLIRANFTITADSWFCVQHICAASASPANQNFGKALNRAGQTEVYTQMKCRKITN